MPNNLAPIISGLYKVTGFNGCLIRNLTLSSATLRIFAAQTHTCREALVAKQQGTQDFLRIIAEANSFLQPGGFLLFEHGYQQGNHVQNLLDLAGFKLTEQFEDLQGHPRATIGQKL